MSNAGKNTHGQILKSSAMIGGSTVLNIAFGILRTKAMAVLLLPEAFALFSFYQRIIDLVRTVAGMGINTSGVREIAEAVGSGEQQRIIRTVTTLRRVAFIFGALGALLLVAFCRPVSRLTFGDDKHAGSVALLGLAVLFMDVSAGQGAVVQGMRRIADLARINVWGAFFGAVFSIPIIYFFREDGVAPSLVCVAGMGVLTSWWYARKVKVERVSLSLRDMWREASALLRMGVVFMSTSFMAMGVAYVLPIIVDRHLGRAAVAYYSAAWAFGGLYIGIILQAMGADFYPRLTAVAKNNAECNRLVNEQVEVGLLMAVPGLLAMLTFGPLVIELFYSAKYGPAVVVLRWICLGMMLRVVSWPLGFTLLAKGERKLFFWSEFFASLAAVGLLWLGVRFQGLAGAGMAFFGLYVLYATGIYLVVRQLSGFRWSAANRRLGALFGLLVVVGFLLGGDALPVLIGADFGHLICRILGAGMALATGVYSLRTICTLVPLQRLPRLAQKLLIRFRLVPSGGGI